MVLVKVLRITSYNDPETGKAGKQVELVEVRQRGGQPFVMGGVGEDEARVVKGIVSQLQSMGLFPQMREFVFPKLSLFLTENEYDLLGTRLEVNDTYELVFKDGSISLQKPEGV